MSENESSSVGEAAVTSEFGEIDFLHEIGSRMAASDPLHALLERIVEFASSVVQCDSCFIYVLEKEELVLRASKNPHADIVDRLNLQVGQGITGWVAAHKQPVVIARDAAHDSRFKMFHELPEDHFEAFLSIPITGRGKLVGVINLQHRQPHEFTHREVQLMSTIGFLVGAEVELARLENENIQLAGQLQTRKILERAKGILQRDLKVSEEEAYLMLQKQSRQRRKSMREIAEAVILGDDLRRPATETTRK